VQDFTADDDRHANYEILQQYGSHKGSKNQTKCIMYGKNYCFWC